MAITGQDIRAAHEQNDEEFAKLREDGTDGADTVVKWLETRGIDEPSFGKFLFEYAENQSEARGWVAGFQDGFQCATNAHKAELDLAEQQPLDTAESVQADAHE